MKEPFLPAARRPDYRPAAPKVAAATEGGSPITDLPRRSRAKAGYHSLLPRERGSAFCRDVASREGGFTLIELLVVIGIIALLMALVVPAFTNIKSGGDVTSAGYTIKGVLDTARTYAKANNTYTWVGFYEEDVSSTTPGTAGVGRLVMSIIASKDGTNVASTGGLIDATKIIQVGKLTKVDNVHLVANLPAFDSRPTVPSAYRIPDTADSTTPFQYPVGSPYTFRKMVQFSPGGEARINNNSNALRTAAEIGLEPTHGNVLPNPTPANLVAIQFGGAGADVVVYRK